ncbi:hypothetical protein IMZ29_04765 [Achromobacter sp. GG226]|uniref:hypothetical protein n=1 Tax=Verticiella alkaliphila TaxID=2779529 RepID=UPI001C0BED2F|nr:hypothetical protein [Verticiella sp. GG226]MBU4609880.1 hypothetical protein [Verticiella sp. GG226]
MHVLLLVALVSLGLVSVVAAAFGVILGGSLIIVGAQGGMGFPFVGVGWREGLVVLAAGNGISCLANVIILALLRWPAELGWLRRLVVRVQVVPAVIALALGIAHGATVWRDDIGRSRAHTVDTQLADGSAAAVSALMRCTGTCEKWLSADNQLLLGARYDRQDWVAMALERGGGLRSYGYRASLETPVSCSAGVVVKYADALELALIHDNAQMIDALLRSADHGAILGALYTAVVLGRQASTQRLLAAAGWPGLPPALADHAEIVTGSRDIVAPAQPLSCDLPSWESLGYPAKGR